MQNKNVLIPCNFPLFCGSTSCMWSLNPCLKLRQMYFWLSFLSFSAERNKSCSLICVLKLVSKVPKFFSINVAKRNLGKVNLKSTRPAVFLTSMHAGWLQEFALPFADESAVFAICYSYAIIAVLLQCFASNFLSCPFLPCWKSVSGKYSVR